MLFRRRPQEPQTPQYALDAYATRPEQYGQHECWLPSPYDPGHAPLEAESSDLRPRQFDCADCGSFYGLHTKTTTSYTRQKVSVVKEVPHPHPMLARQGFTYRTTVTEWQNVPHTSTSLWWEFEEPRAPKPGAPRSHNGRQWWDAEAGKWVQLPGLKPWLPDAPDAVDSQTNLAQTDPPQRP